MTEDDIIQLAASFDSVFVQTAGPDDGSPEVAWGDTFIYYSADGTLPTATQPFATIVTKDYPDDALSHLDRPSTFRVNIAAGRDTFVEWTGHDPREPAGVVDYSAVDVVMPHPVYGTYGWLAVVNPGEGTEAAVRTLIGRAYDLASSRARRRADLDAP